MEKTLIAYEAGVSDLHPGLYPGSNEISLSGKLPPQPFVGMLACHLLLEGTISLRNQLLHLEDMKREEPLT